MAKPKKGRRASSGRDPGGFVAIPWTVLDSNAYQSLSHPARSLLLEIARQYHGDDNGRMIATLAHLKPRGWTSNDTIQRAKQELLDAGLIFETVNYGNALAIAARAQDAHIAGLLEQCGERPRPGETAAAAADRLAQLSEDELVTLMVRNGRMTPVEAAQYRVGRAVLGDTPPRNREERRRAAKAARA
ncbi:hypothetical protein [Burkholderia anthina]|uniref:hypothetical protein n=1 Tax=Burkholderia anthina TaxID=179879 RepID=UPI00158A44E8|nr:hypothetical protein [Burkholderia anthina]